MLEWSLECRYCERYFGGVALPPFSWWTRTLGATCKHCGHHYSPSELKKMENDKYGR